ncbi:MAG: epoxyqueuosine reductase [Candidatus Baldrarchaeia archaeon]
MKKNFTNQLMKLAVSLGAALVGVADLNLLKQLETNPPNLLENFKYAISIAVPLPKNVFELITEENPGELYAHAYRTANMLLDQITFRLAQKITEYGYNAQPVPASMTIDEKSAMGHVSHKAFARAAGLGWIGKNILLITPEYGPRVRLATVLTDMPLIPGKPLENRCGNCTKCIDACPVGALKPSNFKDYPVNRDEVFDVEKCYSRLKKISKLPNIGEQICGMCIKVCPVGEKII